MNPYHIVLTVMTVFIMFILSHLVMENDRVEKNRKYRFYSTYLFIALAALCEFAAVALNGADEQYRMLLSFMKSLDYTLTPVAGVLFVRQLTERDRFQRIAAGVLIVNGVLALLSNFTEWYFLIDEENVYHHGSLYVLYIAVYISICIYAMLEFLRYAQSFARRHFGSIYFIWAFMFVFITVQQFVSSDIRVVYLTLSVSCALVFAHYCQYRLQESTAMITHQQDLLERDALTDLYNRYSYIHTLEDYEKQSTVPSDLHVISIDINGLKRVNDSMGHQAGDDLICGAAQVIRDTFSPFGKCFRTGGDEFIVILNLLNDEDPKARCEELIASLQSAADSWKGKIVSSVSLSCGYASAVDHPDISVEQLVSIADAYMYRHKQEYYHACDMRR